MVHEVAFPRAACDSAEVVLGGKEFGAALS